MSSKWQRIWKEERAQDLIEYTILLAAIALVASGLFLSAGGGVKGIWKSGDNQLAAANTTSGGGETPSSGGGNRNGHNHGGDQRGHRSFGF